MLKLILVLAAIGAALAPTPAAWIEQYYSRGFYPAIQRPLTSFSNRVPFAMLDVLIPAVAVALVVRLVFRLTDVRRTGWVRTTAAGVTDILGVAATAYLLFLVTWGLNYRRVPLEERLVFEPSTVSRDAAVKMAELAVTELNTLYAPAHAESETFELTGKLGQPFRGAVRDLVDPAVGEIVVPTLGIPKHSVLDLYFRRAGIDGMTNPILLEILINEDVLPFEQPFVVAHEWAHLAGYADESEANLVAWLTCVRGDGWGQYSGWLAVLPVLGRSLDQSTRQRVMSSLSPGPLADLAAVRARLQSANPAIREGAGEVYDRFLKANRVEEGIHSYNRVVLLMLGLKFEAGWKPVLR